MLHDDDLMSFGRDALVQAISIRQIRQPPPLLTDSYIARSILQKAIRRGLAELALQAAATLLHQDRRVLWRRLLVTALEDLGVGQVDLLTRLLAAQRDPNWRRSVGGEWAVIAELIVEACEGTRCQAANDLWNVGQNAPELALFKESLCDAHAQDLVDILSSTGISLTDRAVVTLLVLGGEGSSPIPDHLAPDPELVFSSFGFLGPIVGVYREAFRQTGLALAPLSLCLLSQVQLQPLANGALQSLANWGEELPPVRWIGAVPSFALDQYTRVGLAAVRQYCRTSTAWRRLSKRWEIPWSHQPKAAGELLFRLDGARLTNRREWPLGRQTFSRSATLGCFLPEDAVDEASALMRREMPLIEQLRCQSTSHLGAAN